MLIYLGIKKQQRLKQKGVRMNLIRPRIWRLAMSFLITTVLMVLPALGKDSAVGRAEAVEKISETDIAAQSLRYKIIQSRMLLLYLQDILPVKGNPYFHMAEFASDSTLSSFKKAQATANPFMESTQPSYWLPVAEGETLSTATLSNPNVAPVVQYFAQYVAISEIMQEQIQPTLQASIVIGSVKESAGTAIDLQFQKAWRYIKHYSSRYKALLTEHSGFEARLTFEKKKVTLLTLESIAKGMKPYLSFIKTENKLAVEKFLRTLENLGAAEMKANQIDLAKVKIIKLIDPSSDNYKVVMRALKSVDLPETGDIDGAEEAFEVAMRLEIGFDVLQKMMNHIKENW